MTETPAAWSDLVTWLGALYDEDERDAPTIHRLDCETVTNASACTCGRPARSLAEVDAGRKRLQLHGRWYPSFRSWKCRWCMDIWPCQDLLLLALPHADRPGYREEWRPA